MKALALVAVAGCAGMSLEGAPSEIRWAYCRDEPVACKEEMPTITTLGAGCYEINRRVYECSYDDVPGKQLRCTPDGWAPWRWLRPTSDLSGAQLDGALSTRVIDVSRKIVGRCNALSADHRVSECKHHVLTSYRRPRPSVEMVDGRDPADDPSRFIATAYFTLDTSTPLEIPEVTTLEIARSGKDVVVFSAELCDEGDHLETRTIRNSTGFPALDGVIAAWLPTLHTARPPDDPACTVVAVIVSKIEYSEPPSCR